MNRAEEMAEGEVIPFKRKTATPEVQAFREIYDILTSEERKLDPTQRKNILDRLIRDLLLQDL